MMLHLVMDKSTVSELGFTEVSGTKNIKIQTKKKREEIAQKFEDVRVLSKGIYRE